MQALIFIEAHGKTRAWGEISRSLGMSADIVATSGHLCKYPQSLYPLGVRITKGQAIDAARTIRPDVDQRIRNALYDRKDETRILIATDDDPEGDVIALDVMRVIIDVDPLLIDQCLRVRPSAITKEGVRTAIQTAMDRHGDIDTLVSRAVAGRTRALTDRWMGATFSRMANAGCGRVRAGILGSAFCWTRSPDLVRGLPETGEITFQARSGAGGLPFIAHVSLKGDIPRALASVAQRYAGRLIPGQVSEMKSVGAAVAPRFRDIRPFNTGDALAYAARFHGIDPKSAMAGLQDAYMKGRISYPRTDNRTISESACANVVQSARICGLRDVDIAYARQHSHEDSEETITAHEGLYPTPKMTKDNMDRFRELVRKPVKPVDRKNRGAVEDLMVTLIARRAFEALRNTELVRGVFHPREDSDLSAEEREALEELEWARPVSPNLPWSRTQMTGLRLWPMSSVVIDGMMIEGIGRPSTLASHADLIENSGQLAIPSPGALPEPTMHGKKILNALPRGIWNPATCRMIEEAMSQEAPGEDPGADITARMRSRINFWFRQVTPEVRDSLIEMLKSDGETTARAPSKGQGALKATDVAPEVDSFMDEEEIQMDI